ncbi:hypothetical protein DL766_002495 [Monosporascus sp. MC13-8B]|uniref:Uncharacterized protein n=1 Tax=Monosporascus cannonballus TaxID=155416 RepID=A0ABY0HC90_9PEZI|nr:hypothetical protein DL762_002831 [Monosporascus cannonballus]RYO95568.1 hypothetical protein DL763_003638 [Monosporascus cannonballus]RYP35484.1 hypothetical protein DL766_002495 [Monosporascus sp. MC13-8B]
MEAAGGSGGADGGDMDPGLDLHPVSGAALYELEVSRRQRLGRGNGRTALATGCAEVDDHVLLTGGFERGVVVGVSAAEVDFGVLLGLQTIAHALVFNTDTSTGTNVGTGAGGNNGIDSSTTAQRPPRAAIVTTLAATALLPLLRDVVRAQVQAKLGCSSAHHPAVGPQVRACLERISVSQVFDLDGLWEVLAELETPLPVDPLQGKGEGDGDGDRGGDRIGGAGTAGEEKAVASASDAPPKSHHDSEQPLQESPEASPRPPVRDRRNEREEIQDSEDEEEEGLSPTPSSPPPKTTTAKSAGVKVSAASSDPPAESPPPQPKQEKRAAKSKEEGDPHAHFPDIILATHFSSLLTTLFMQRDKAGAHAALQLLSAHLRYLARFAGPLIMLLNSTSSLSVSSSTTTTTTSHNTNTNNPSSTAITAAAATNPDRRPIDPTLRSIFGRGTATAAAAYTGRTGYAPSTRADKPAYGATFAQLLDLHLLCTRVPRTRADVEALFLPLPPGLTGSAAGAVVRYAWVVEVLLDEVGVWVWRDDIDGDRGNGGGGGEKGKGVGENTEMANRDRDGDRNWEWRRRSREQRWGAVDIRGGVRIVNAFPGGVEGVRNVGRLRGV